MNNELDRIVACLDAIEHPKKYPGWYPLGNKLLRLFGLDALLEIHSELGEAMLKRMGVKGFVGRCYRVGWEKKANFEKMEWAGLEPARTGKNEEGFGSIGEILSHLNKKITIAGMPEMEDAHV